MPRRGPFKPFRTRDVEATRRRVSERIEQAVTVHRMWSTFYDEVLVPRCIVADDPDSKLAVEWFRRAFYAGASAMFELVTRVAPDEIDEDAGAAMLQRIFEELQTYAKVLGTDTRSS